MKNVVLSVCVPVYNGEKYLKESIGSILRQTYGNFELIIVDDCSEDGSERVVRSFSDPRVKYVKNSINLGLVKNWNRCIEESIGRYISIFHQDDVMMPSNFENKIKVLQKDDSIGFVCSNFYEIDSDSNYLQTKSNWANMSPGKDFVKGVGELLEDMLLGDNFICCPTVIARRECYEKLGMFDTNLTFTCDWEMWMRIMLFYKWAYLAEPLVKYRWSGANVSFSFLGKLQGIEQEYIAKMNVIKKHPKRLPNNRRLKRMITETASRKALYWGRYSSSRCQDAVKSLMFALRTRPSLVFNSKDIYLCIAVFIKAFLLAIKDAYN